MRDPEGKAVTPCIQARVLRRVVGMEGVQGPSEPQQEGSETLYWGGVGTLSTAEGRDPPTKQGEPRATRSFMCDGIMEIPSSLLFLKK